MKKQLDKQLDDIITKAQWAIDYIIEYRKNPDCFDPLTVLTGTERKRNKLFLECCSFLDDLETAKENFVNTRNKYL